MRESNFHIFNTPTKAKANVEFSEDLYQIISPEKIIKPCLIQQIFAENTNHHINFFSSGQFENSFVSENYSIDYQDYFSEQSKNGQDQKQQIYQTVKKGISSFLIPLEQKNLLTIKVTKKGCNCQQSKCLKNYCICYKNGGTCSSDCQCIDCENTQITSQHQKNQKKTLQLISNLNLKGCNCKNSNCMKGYCICHSNGKKCSKLCKCLNCFNNEKHQKDDQQKNDQKINNYGLTCKKKVKISQFQFANDKQNIFLKVNN